MAGPNRSGRNENESTPPPPAPRAEQRSEKIIDMQSFHSNLKWTDWALIIAYIATPLVIGFWTLRRSKRNAEEYLMAGRSMNWIVVAIAVFATLFSTISFVMVPGESYNHGLVMMLPATLGILALPLAVWLFLRFFFMAPTFTAYEYLEQRYCPACRRLGSLLFVILRLLYAGAVFYSAAVIFQSLVGWPPLVTILIIGTITIIYTVVGGIKAVIIADVVQSGIIFFGIVAIFYSLLQMTGFHLPAVLSFASAHDHTFELFTQRSFYQIDVHERLNFWLLLWWLVTAPLISLSCDQLVVQRLLTSKNYRQARRSVYLNYLMGIPVGLMLFLIGLFLFFIYQSGIRNLPPDINGDQVLGYFINTELPAPVPGLIVAALLSALMSTISGAVNSLATVCWKDLVVPFRPQWAGGSLEMRWCRLLSVAMGVIGVGVAAFLSLAGEGVKSSLMEVVAVWSNLWSVLFVAFLYGVLNTRVSARAILVTLAVAGLIQIVFPYYMYYCVPLEHRWGFSWLGVPGQVIALILPPLLSIWWPNRKDLTNLTLWTLDRSRLKDQSYDA